MRAAQALNAIMYFIEFKNKAIAHTHFVNYRHCVKAATHTHFLNVDLDILSKSTLQPLVDAFGKKVIVLFSGKVKRTYRAHLELAKMTKTADATVKDFCALVEALPNAERALWNRAKASRL
jgi:hypothetical protein